MKRMEVLESLDCEFKPQIRYAECKPEEIKNLRITHNIQLSATTGVIRRWLFYKLMRLAFWIGQPVGEVEEIRWAE